MKWISSNPTALSYRRLQCRNNAVPLAATTIPIRHNTALSYDTTAALNIQALDPDAEYELQDADTGKKLRERGVRVTMETAPESRLVFYRLHK